jgi:hypothetical protein
MRYMKLAPSLNDLVPVLRQLLLNDHVWSTNLENAKGIHLAVLVEPFLGYILEGTKTIESRFSVKRIAPFERIATGDLVLLKRSGGPIVALAKVQRPEFVVLCAKTWPKVRALAKPLCADESFWRDRVQKKYATLLRMAAVREIPQFSVAKIDRRAWVVLRDPSQRHLKFQ